MSLLLDALKKAAEQKAEKERSKNNQSYSTSDATVVLEHTQTEIDRTVAFDKDQTDFLGDKTERVEQTATIDLEEDETEILDSDATVMLDNNDARQTISADETGAEGHFDADETKLDPTEGAHSKEYQQSTKSSKREKGTDDTEIAETIFASNLDEDETEILDSDATVMLDNNDARQTISADETGAEGHFDADETKLDPTEGAHSKEYQQSTKSSKREKGTDDTEIAETIYASNLDEDETEILTDEDVTEFLGNRDQANKQLQPKSDKVKDSSTEFDATPAEPDLEDKSDTEAEDTSLKLISIDDTTTQSGVKSGDSIDATGTITEARVQILARGSHSTETLDLVDIPQDNYSDSDTVTNRPVALGSVPDKETASGQDSTSTRTYAPDNYDRTLMKASQDDASQLFAGMKAESDVVMTPDYAKKVFISKSSVQRRNDYKIYSGVGAAILLVIFMFGLFEYEEESENIDNSLRALKRDPMPNIPRKSVDKAPASLFELNRNSEIDTKTLALVKNAGDLSELGLGPDETTVDDVEASGTIKAGEIASVTEDKKSAEAATSVKGNKVAVTQAVTNNSNSDVETSSPSFQLSSRNTVAGKDNLLKEAYAAYLQGDNDTALEKYNQVLAEDPLNRNALLAHAAISVQNKNSTAAILDYQKLLIANPKDSLAMSSLISVASISPTKSESQLKGMIRDEPRSPYLNFALANVYGAQNRWQEAQNHYFTALENNPNDPNYAYNLAVSLEHIAKPKVAVTYYQRALANINNGLATFNKEIVDQRVEILQKL